VPGMGDDVQSIKAGIMEIADIFVINKADREGADAVEKEIRAMQSLAGRNAQGGSWITPIVKTMATTGEGIDDLLSAVERMKQWLAQEGRLEARRKSYWRERIEEMVRHSLLKEARAHGLSDEELTGHAERVAAGREDPYQLAPRLVAQVFSARGARS
jgi:LAO/AO transport system kinase